MERLKHLFGISLLACCGLLASCNSDDEMDNTLPDGKYPMAFSASVEGQIQTRATTDNSWTGGEEVAVRIGSEVKKYTAAADGNLTGADNGNTFYWQTSVETKNVAAWHIGTGYSAALPTTWSVQSDQSGDGFQQSDLLYAPEKSISFTDNAKQLNFYHQTAKVVINIVNAEAATDADAITGVVIGNANNLALSGTYTAPTAGATAGTWSNPNTAGTITPKTLTASGSYLKTYTALVIPQDMQGKKFIAVTLTDGNTYYYTPANATDANLQAGKVHTYDITVKHGYLEVVAAEVSGVWDDNGETPVTGKILATGYAADDLKIGDYYYSDGTTSDGGYRQYADGSTDHLGVMPVLTGGRTVLGIVLKVGKDATGDWADTDTYTDKNGQSMATLHGYVLALYDADGGNTCQWRYDAAVGTNTLQNTLFCGYSNTQTIKSYASGNTLTLSSAFPATYWATDDYETRESGKYASPSNSSGWFLPSAGQCWYWYQNRAILQTSMEKAKGSNSWQYSYWSSSENSFDPTYSARYISFLYDSVGNKSKSIVSYVRSCLAF